MTSKEYAILAAGVSSTFNRNRQSGMDADLLDKDLDAEQLKADQMPGLVLTMWQTNPDIDVNWKEDWLKAIGTKNWDCIAIGGGLRGKFDLTDHFEFMVNAIKDKSPQTVIVFPPKPDKILERALGHLSSTGRD